MKSYNNSVYGRSFSSIFCVSFSLLSFLFLFIVIPTCLGYAIKYVERECKETSRKRLKGEIITWTAVHRKCFVKNCGVRCNVYTFCVSGVPNLCKNLNDCSIASLSISLSIEYYILLLNVTFRISTLCNVALAAHAQLLLVMLSGRIEPMDELIHCSHRTVYCTLIRQYVGIQ